MGNTAKAIAIITAQLGMGAVFAIAGPGIHGTAQASPVCTTDTHVCAPQCAYEDGNPNGMPCLWVDPDTGDAYYVESENYR